jgi:hypothetical protein
MSEPQAKPSAWKSPRACECGCGVVFVPRRPWAKFQADECRDVYWARLKREALDIVRNRAEATA